MSTQETFSDDFISATTAEADRLRAESERLNQEADHAQARVDQIRAQAAALDEQARELNELLGRAPQLRLDLPSDGLTGRRLREAAVEVLANERGVGIPVHYREWFDLVTASGIQVGGRDPIATFLTQIIRSPVVKRAGERGLYLVDPAAGQTEGVKVRRRAVDEVGAAELRLAETAPDDPHRRDVEVALAAARKRLQAAERELREVARIKAAIQ